MGPKEPRNDPKQLPATKGDRMGSIMLVLPTEDFTAKVGRAHIPPEAVVDGRAELVIDADELRGGLPRCVQWEKRRGLTKLIQSPPRLRNGSRPHERRVVIKRNTPRNLVFGIAQEGRELSRIPRKGGELHSGTRLETEVLTLGQHLVVSQPVLVVGEFLQGNIPRERLGRAMLIRTGVGMAQARRISIARSNFRWS